MFTQVRRFIKTGVGFLLVGLLIGFYMLVQRDLLGVWPHPYVRSAHAHAVAVGFVMFLILGVALWLFPRAEKTDRRYRPERIALAYWLLTGATAVRIGAELLLALYDPMWLRSLSVLAGAGQLSGFALYFWTMWRRIRPVGSHLREAKGERF